MRLSLPAGFQEFLSTPDAARAPQWQLDWLSSREWPVNAEPTCETFRHMREALDTLAPPPRDPAGR